MPSAQIAKMSRAVVTVAVGLPASAASGYLSFFRLSHPDKAGPHFPSPPVSQSFPHSKL